MDFTSSLIQKLQGNASAANALPMAKYMKDLFPFFGIKSEARKTIYKETAALHKNEIKTDYREIAKHLFELPEREYQYCAIDLLVKQWPKHFELKDIELIEYFLTTKSWWDSVDPLAKYILGGYLKQFPDETESVIERFAGSDNMWLNRSAIIYQLGYKKDTDVARLFSVCEHFNTSREFFIQKAIGWALREYAKTSPEAVKEFVTHTNLKPLSVREALKNI
nr:DNA alkylation repair protein [uncultured Flavobacterium sp.]